MCVCVCLYGSLQMGVCVCVFVCLSVWLHGSLPLHVSVCVCLSVCLSVCRIPCRGLCVFVCALMRVLCTLNNSQPSLKRGYGLPRLLKKKINPPKIVLKLVNEKLIVPVRYRCKNQADFAFTYPLISPF